MSTVVAYLTCIPVLWAAVGGGGGCFDYFTVWGRCNFKKRKHKADNFMLPLSPCGQGSEERHPVDDLQLSARWAPDHLFRRHFRPSATYYRDITQGSKTGALEWFNFGRFPDLTSFIDRFYTQEIWLMTSCTLLSCREVSSSSAEV
jgi:hypothetical protein